MVVGGQHHAPGRFSPVKGPVPIVQDAWLAPTGIRSIARSLVAIPTTSIADAIFFWYFLNNIHFLTQGRGFCVIGVNTFITRKQLLPNSFTVTNVLCRL
jgi:hypothetical protein